MHRELDAAREIMASQVLYIFLIIDIVDLDLKILPLLKVILHVKALHPRWAQVVHDDLSHSDSLPLIAHLLVEDNHTICSGECIQIGQVFAREAQTDGLDEAA